jgi:hypothetical protein
MPLLPHDPDDFTGMEDEEILAEIKARRADRANLDPHAQFVEKYKRRERARHDAAQGEWDKKATLWNSIFHPFKYERETNAIMKEINSANADYLDTLERSIREKKADAVKADARTKAAQSKG